LMSVCQVIRRCLANSPYFCSTATSNLSERRKSVSFPATMQAQKRMKRVALVGRFCTFFNKDIANTNSTLHGQITSKPPLSLVCWRIQQKWLGYHLAQCHIQYHHHGKTSHRGHRYSIDILKFSLRLWNKFFNNDKDHCSGCKAQCIG